MDHGGTCRVLYIHVCVCVTSHCTNTPWNIAHEYNVIKLHPLYVYDEIIILPSIHYYSVYFNYSIIISGPHCDERKGVRNCMTLCFTLSYSFTPSYYSQFLPFLNCTRVCGCVCGCGCVDVGVCVCVCVYSCTARYSVVYSLMPLLFNSESLELFLLLVPLSKLKDNNDDSNNNT